MNSTQKEIADAIRENVRAFRHKESGEIKYVLVCASDGSQDIADEWEDVMVIPNISNQAIDYLIRTPTGTIK